MPEIEPTPPPPRTALLRTLAEQLGRIVPGWRCIGRGILADATRMDLVGTTAADRALVVAVAEEGRELESLARALAHRAWLAPRLRDWLQLAPDLDLDPEAGVEALALVHDPGAEVRAAAAAIPPEVLRLARYRFLANGGSTGVLLELVTSAGEAPPPRAPAPLPAVRPLGAETPPFRTGLSEEDLGLTDEERGEFE